MHRLVYSYMQSITYTHVYNTDFCIHTHRYIGTYIIVYIHIDIHMKYSRGVLGTSVQIIFRI